MEEENNCVEVPEAVFIAWERSTLKLNGEESTVDEFYETLILCQIELFVMEICLYVLMENMKVLSYVVLDRRLIVK